MKEEAIGRALDEGAAEKPQPHQEGDSGPALIVRERDGEMVEASINDPEDARPVKARFNRDEEKSKVDAKGLFEGVKALLNSREALDLAMNVVRGSRTRRDGATTTTELDAEGLKALKKLAKRLPRGIPIKPEAILARIHRRNEAGLHFVLGGIVLPNTLDELRARLPETFKVRGIRFHVPGLHKQLERFSMENEALLLSVIEAMGGIYALFGLEPEGARA